MKCLNHPALGFAFVLLLTGCVSAPRSLPIADLPPRFATTAPSRVIAVPFWQAFRDPQLEALVAAGLARNLSITEAMAVVDEAEASAKGAGAANAPTLTLGLGAARGQAEGSAATLSTGSAGLATSWLFDLFGGTRSTREAALAELEGARLAQQAARVSVASAVTLTYLELRLYQQQIALTQRSITSRKEALELTEVMATQGQIGRLGVVQAEQAIAEAEAALPPLEISYDTALNRLATLTASRVADLRPQLDRSARQPTPQGKPSVGLPAEVIQARPDVKIAERNLAAALARVGVAEAAFWPSVTLAGTITPTMTRGAANSTPWSIGPRIDLPIFAGGARKANLSAAEARAVQAEARWRASVLSAVEEVETGLSAWRRGGQNVAAQKRLVVAAEETVALAMATWTAGEGDFFTVLKAEQDLLTARSSLAAALRDAASAYVTLSIAAGGGVE